MHGLRIRNVSRFATIATKMTRASARDLGPDLVQMARENPAIETRFESTSRQRASAQSDLTDDIGSRWISHPAREECGSERDLVSKSAAGKSRVRTKKVDRRHRRSSGTDPTQARSRLYLRVDAFGASAMSVPLLGGQNQA